VNLSVVDSLFKVAFHAFESGGKNFLDSSDDFHFALSLCGVLLVVILVFLASCFLLCEAFSGGFEFFLVIVHSLGLVSEFGGGFEELFLGLFLGDSQVVLD